MNFKTHPILIQRAEDKKYNFPIKNYINISDKKYRIKLAENFDEIDEALKLRFEVFNLELKEGFDRSYETLRDEDKFDKQYHHLLVIELATEEVIGTYRLQTYEIAKEGIGFLADTEFYLNSIGEDILKKSVEAGRACIARDHRNTRVLFLLWKGIAQYLRMNNKRYLFGCACINSQNPIDGVSFMEKLIKNNHYHKNILLEVRDDFKCILPNGVDNERANIEIPPLMDIYLRYKAKVISKPAIDRDFKSTDYLMMLDIHDLPEESKELFF